MGVDLNDKADFRRVANGVATGRKIGEAALQHFTRFTLELGGQNPMIVLSGVDVSSHVERK